MNTLKSLVIASSCVLLVATATAQDRPDGAGPAAGLSRSSEGGGFHGPDSSGNLTVNVWNWYLPLDTWSYDAGSQRNLWMEMRSSGDYIYIYAYDERAQMMNHSASGNHYIGIYWTSSSTWSNSRLWYY